MAQKRKLQVFVSSTYVDMREERQAAVEAILTAGHIPAGMELFTAGDESQMQAIKRWIDESDVFLLILGGRYGSIEPNSQKSYIHLEYEYALEQHKPYFAVVIEENYLKQKVMKLGPDVIETEHTPKLREFRKFVCKHIVRTWSDPRDIKLAILETLSEYSRREDVVGWIPGNEAVNTVVLAEIARLTKENAMLRGQLEKFSNQSTEKENVLYNNLTFYEMCDILKRDIIENDVEKDKMDILVNIANIFEDETSSILHLLWVSRDTLFSGEFHSYYGPYEKYIEKLRSYGLVENRGGNVIFSDAGRQFCMRLMIDGKAKMADGYKMDL
jgi:hypothetical protein